MSCLIKHEHRKGYVVVFPIGLERTQPGFVGPTSEKENVYQIDRIYTELLGAHDNVAGIHRSAEHRIWRLVQGSDEPVIVLPGVTKNGPMKAPLRK